MSWSIRYKSVLVSVLAISVAVLVLTTVASAKGKGKGSGKGPPGWDKGEKKGWTSDVPPGIEKKGGWMPPGLSKEEQTEWKDGRPPGWSRGRKEGWTSDIPPGIEKKGEWMPPGLSKMRPPGWDKWSEERKKGWEIDLDEARTDFESALISVEMSARKGVPIKHARAIVVAAMVKGMRGEGIERATRAVAYGVGRKVDFDQLGKYVHGKLNEGLRGDDLAIEIYKEVARRHEEKMKVKEAIRKQKGKGKKK